jgi:DNA (cytosine-5)-methyltransferase 1
MIAGQIDSPIIRAVDLFCGVGGLTHGLVKGGIEVAAGYDVDPICRYPYEANNEAVFVEKDITQLTASEIVDKLGDAPITMVAGCAPCQPFSTYSRTGRVERGDADWELVATFGRLARDVRPHLVTMENVPAVEHHPVFSDFLSCLSEYAVAYRTVQCATIGVPQTRKRLVLVASRLSGEPPSLDWKPCKKATVRQVISGLPALRAGEGSQNDPLHLACRLSDLNLRRIQASRPGQTWRDWPADLRASCHSKASGETFPSVYGRMEWDEPAPTITTQCFGYGNGRFGHPEQDRAITLREAAILQTFPPDYKFVKNGERVRFSLLGRLIGNAVPVGLGQCLAQSFRTHVSRAWRPAAN